MSNARYVVVPCIGSVARPDTTKEEGSMRIHTSLTYQQMRTVAQASGAPIYTETLELHGSRTHERAFEVILSGSSTNRSQSGDFFAATWDEWGAFLGALYDMDPKARCGNSARFPTYRDADHFHFATGDRFHNIANKWDLDANVPRYLPADTHPQHHWEFSGEAGFWCTKCKAKRPTHQAADAYAPRAYS